MAKPPPDRIVANDGERILIRPMDTADLYMVFAHVTLLRSCWDLSSSLACSDITKTRSMRLAATIRTPLTVRNWSTDSYEGMPVSKYLEKATLFLNALRRKAEGPEQLAAFLGSSGAPGQSLGQLGLMPDKLLGARFQIVPADLMQALWFQLGEVLAK